ncbi:hypothetical protein [Streptomyces luteolus]|uniref:Ribosomal protein L7/L12 C-terminal domain-containing protein n=1 Tax=Streptomyces luteolus TaxID=3043615 RepID=A0ABT6T0I8_9ACTN|nr:hypothetical protein [Streptomyces sp. B-S-A12]MDI3421156.1 hypothetical protein [Streptomyces sp. B-S-A12]
MYIAFGFMFAVMLLLATSIVESKVKRVEARTARVERKLDLIIEHLGVDAGGLMPDLAPVHALLAEGKEVQAVKAYRQITGVGLKEAADEVRRLGGTPR